MIKKIDAHTHIFPEKIAAKASASIGEFYGNFHPMEGDGSLSMLLSLGEKAGVDGFVVFSAATSPSQVESINTFIAQEVREYPDKLTGLGTLHPDMENPEKEIDRIISLGLKGIKLHPDFQKFQANSPEAMRMYAYLEGKLPVLFHAGDPRYQYSSPHRIAQISDAFPNLDIVAAHMGGWAETRQAMEWIIPREKILVDTCSSLYAMSDEQATQLIRLYGADRVLFGTDYPMWSYGEEAQKLERLPLSDEEREKIFHKNAEKLFRIGE